MPKISRSEEHTSELQSRENLVCRLLLEKKKLHFSVAPFSYLCVFFVLISVLFSFFLSFFPPFFSPFSLRFSLIFSLLFSLFFLMIRQPTRSTLFPYTTLFR